MKKVFFYLVVCALLCIALLSFPVEAQNARLGGFTPNNQVTIAFPKSSYPLGSTAPADISIAGSPDGTYTVYIKDPSGQQVGKIDLQIGGAPGSNKGTVNIVLPGNEDKITYTASLTIGGATVFGKATVDVTKAAPTPTATPAPTEGVKEVSISGRLDANGNTFNLEAIRGNSTQFSVSALSSQGLFLVDQEVKLSATLGTLPPEAVFTQGPIGSTNHKNTVGTFKSNGTGGWGGVRAEVGGKSDSKTVLCHLVRVKDFNEPKFLRYRPGSNDNNLSNPKVEFIIEDEPSVGIEFQVECTIYSLDGHQPIARHAWLVTSAGKHTKQWNDFFSAENDPGEGIYPFQIKVVCTKMNEEVLKSKGLEPSFLAYFNPGVYPNYIPTGSDWKASQSLTIKPQRQNAWALSYDENSDSTKLAYIVDIYSANGKEPQTVRVDVYDPELNKVGEVTNQTIEHTVVPDASGDGKTFTYYFNGPVNLESAGDYHFIVEAQSAADDPNAEKEDKDAGKWALEQNSSAKVPTYVTFGGKSPAIKGPGLGEAFGQSLETGNVSIAAANRLQRGGYKALLPKPAPWWATGYRGVYDAGFDSVADVVGLQTPTITQLKQQAIQYNAVWLYAGHGGGGNLMAVWDPAGGSTNKNDIGADDPNWSFISADGTSFPVGASSPDNVNLSRLPQTVKGYHRNKQFVRLADGSPLQYARLVCFIGCDTAGNGANPDLPTMAVRLGARNAVGITRVCVGSNAVNITSSLFDYLEPSKNNGNAYSLYQAASRASDNIFPGDYGAIKVTGRTQGSGVFGTNFGWGGDGLGPEGR